MQKITSSFRGAGIGLFRSDANLFKQNILLAWFPCGKNANMSILRAYWVCPKIQLSILNCPLEQKQQEHFDFSSNDSDGWPIFFFGSTGMLYGLKFVYLYLQVIFVWRERTNTTCTFRYRIFSKGRRRSKEGSNRGRSRACYERIRWGCDRSSRGCERRLGFFIKH